MRNVILILAATALLFSCKKNTRASDCALIQCSTGLSWKLRLTDKTTGKNLTFGADAKLNANAVSMWANNNQLTLRKADSLDSKGYYLVDMTRQLMLSTTPAILNLKIKTDHSSDTTVVPLKLVREMSGCCGMGVTGAYMNNGTTLYKISNIDYVVNIPVE